MRKICCYEALSTVAALTFASSISADEVPRQFRIWGSKAPEKLSSNPIPGKYGIESLRIPQNMTKVAPETNMVLDADAAGKYSASGVVPFAWHPMRAIYSVTAPTANIMGKAARAAADDHPPKLAQQPPSKAQKSPYQRILEYGSAFAARRRAGEQ